MKLFILTLFVILSSCCEEAEPESHDHEFSFTVVNGELPEPPERFRIVSKAIYDLIKQDDHPAFEKYTETIPLSDNATFHLVPIQGGEFAMGSSADDPDHKPDELPAHCVQVDSFWMASTETTWAMYQGFLHQANLNHQDAYGFPLEPVSDQPIDMISGPSSPYLPSHSGPYRDNEPGASQPNMKEPAIGMSRHSALKFCQWLTAQTRHYYRLPTEAEWEYACRAGTTTRYSFGDNEALLHEYGRFHESDLDDLRLDPVASKKPNPWGLYDMHGNAGEWTLDAYKPDYQKLSGVIKNPISFSPKLHQGVARGGSFDHDPEDLRSATRLPACREWNLGDPQRPASIWYHSDTLWLGFRIVRPLKTPSLEEAHLIWNVDSGKFWNFE
ncbi:formylglycine-generating enzyme family protein [Akkermansiaceae bacterium]|nr:formylglycine-generating enzyme family protein [Akkermansiaceae bacterium]MDB4384051.1 formylglycine-generating enzyme family protein [Akkermansiaceae bacterium]